LSLSQTLGPASIKLDKADPVVPIKPGEWFTEEVIADGDVITVLVQGIEVAKFKNIRHKMMSGAIGLMCRGNSKVVFRKIEIKELNGVGVDGPPARGGGPGKIQVTADWIRAARIWGGGHWQVEGADLVQTTFDRGALILFGDPAWTNYEFSADVKVVEGTPQAALVFRAGGEFQQGFYWYDETIWRWLLGATPPFSILAHNRPGDASRPLGRWSKIRVRIQ
jgi:Domain of Unknown Function (DUF1080)